MDKPTLVIIAWKYICGQYYQGFVDDYKSVLSQHCMATVTTYGHYTSVLPAEKGMQLLPPVVVPRRSDSVVID